MMKPHSEKIRSYPTNQLTTNFFATLSTNIARLAEAGADIIRLDVGSPDLPPAPHIIESLSISAQRAESHGYQGHRGTGGFRAAWAEMYRRVHGVALEAADILPLLGSKEGVFHLSMAVLNPGDLVLVPDPGYQTYAQGARFAGAEPVPLPLLSERDYLPDLDAVPEEIAHQAKILWLNFPNNPTGAVTDLAFFESAVSFCRQHGILLCHDAAYTQVTFDGYHAPSMLQVPGASEVAVEFNTLSKSHNMAGWRVGAAVGQPDSIAALLKLKTHADSGHFLPVIQAAVSAMTGDQSWLSERNATYQARRDAVITGLKKMGLRPNHPKASLYVWFPVPGRWDSESFALTLLENAYVSLAPGTVFGSRGQGYIRISLTQPLERIHQALDRIHHWLQLEVDG